MAARLARRDERARTRRPNRVSRSRRHASRGPTSASRTHAPAGSRAARFRRPPPSMDSGHRARRQARADRSRAASATSRMPCCPAPTAGCSTARTRSASWRRMALDNQRNLKLAFHRDPLFLNVAREVAAEINQMGAAVSRSSGDCTTGRSSSKFTTRIFRARGLHLDDRHVRRSDGTGFSASIVDLVLYVVNNAAQLRQDGSSVVLYLPKIQTAEEAALWNDIIAALEAHLGLPTGTIKVYVLVEQLEACFQLMEIRAALGRHFVGFNTGRWDYINSVADAMTWDPIVRAPEHRRRHDDVWLHAQLRGSGAARGQHARRRRDSSRSGRGAWSRTSRSDPPRAWPAGMAKARRRRRARAARGRERQVGRALEDGPHRPAGVGEGRTGQSARALRFRP